MEEVDADVPSIGGISWLLLIDVDDEEEEEFAAAILFSDELDGVGTAIFEGDEEGLFMKRSALKEYLRGNSNGGGKLKADADDDCWLLPFGDICGWLFERGWGIKLLLSEVLSNDECVEEWEEVEVALAELLEK